LLLASTFYKHPVPGFIFTALVCGACIAFAVWVYLTNFGPRAKNTHNPDGSKQ
jgi:hypothetical protein